VCDGNTGYAETVQIKFDPAVISYRDILSIFFTVHDPTTLNRQGHDAGTQYRSVIFYHDRGQQETAGQVMQEVLAAGIWKDPLVTELVPFQKFYPAEGHHQEYYANNRFQPYCQFVITPKLAKFRQQFSDRLKNKPK
jgi:peptide-methionine (S)-S-oxide reductase